MNLQENINRMKLELAEMEQQLKEETIYPIFKRGKRFGNILKFTSLESAEILTEGSPNYTVGYKREGWIPHTDTDTWADVSYDSDRELYDTQMVYVWEREDAHEIQIRFYNVKNRCTFDFDGSRFGSIWDNYEAVPYEHQPERMKEAQKSLKL